MDTYSSIIGQGFEHYTEDLKKCMKKNNIHLLMEVLIDLPPANYSQNKKFALILKKYPACSNDFKKIVECFCTRGFKQALKYYNTVYKKHPLPKDDEDESSNQVQPTPQPQTTTPTVIQMPDIGKLTNRQKFDEIVYLTIKNVEIQKERGGRDGVKQLEETTQEIRKEVRKANVAIDDSFFELQNMIEQVNTKTKMKADDIKAQMVKLQQVVHTVQEKIRQNTNVIDSNVEKLMEESEELRVNTGQSEEFNEYIYYRVFTLISRAVGSEKGKWMEMLHFLMEGYPQIIIDKVIIEIEEEHPSEVDMAYDSLTRWKYYNSTSKDRLAQLTRVISKIGYRHLIGEINKIIDDYTKNTEVSIKGVLDDSTLKALSQDMGSEYLTIAQSLDLSKARISKIESQYANDENERNYHMLMEWRDMQEGYNTTSLAKLSGALMQSNKPELVTKLDYLVQNKITIPPSANLYDVYLTQTDTKRQSFA